MVYADTPTACLIPQMIARCGRPGSKRPMAIPIEWFAPKFPLSGKIAGSSYKLQAMGGLLPRL